jgi:hypothetical protein
LALRGLLHAGLGCASREGERHCDDSAHRKTLFYIPGAEALVGVTIATRPFSVGNPRPTKLPNNNPVGAPRNFDIAADGQRFIFTTGQGSGTYAPQVQVVVSWFEELKARVPVVR